MFAWVRRWLGRQPWWVRVALVAAVLLSSFNLTVAWVGGTSIFPLSPFFLRTRALALGAYLKHRPGCLFDGHDDLKPYVRRASRKYRLPKGLLAALVQVESEGRVHRISPAGAMGPGQLMPDTAKQLGVGDPFDPQEAVDGSARYLAEQLRRFHGNVKLALAAYNAGPGQISGGVIPKNGESEFYVEKVMREYNSARR